MPECVWCHQLYGLSIEGQGREHSRDECSAIIRGAERQRCAKLAKDFTDWKWSKRDPYARNEDGTTHLLTEESMDALAKEILGP